MAALTLRPTLVLGTLAIPALLACAAKAREVSVEPAARRAVATSLLGQPLYATPLDSATRLRLEKDLAQAQSAAAANPNDPDALIWVGRRYGYLGEYHEAIRTFSEGVRRFPNDARMLRHRGHRYITIRKLDDAIRDLERAATLMAGKPDEVEPDGQPNARNIPIGSLRSNVWYHLALAYYLKGDWSNAERVARQGVAVSNNPDRLVSQTHWLYMALRLAGRDREAARVLEPIQDGFDIIENGSYYTLVKMYKVGVRPATLDSVMGPGVSSPSNASLAYGLANWFLYSGDTARAVRAFERIIGSNQWASFGFIAAEADLARLRRR